MSEIDPGNQGINCILCRHCAEAMISLREGDTGFEIEIANERPASTLRILRESEVVYEKTRRPLRSPFDGCQATRTEFRDAFVSVKHQLLFSRDDSIGTYPGSVWCSYASRHVKRWRHARSAD